MAPGFPRLLSLAAVFSASLGVGLIFGFQSPLIALVLARNGASSFEIGAVTSLSTIAVIVFGPIYPRILARLGLRLAVIVGTGIGVAIQFLMPVWESVPAWMVLRFVTGCALGLAWIASEIWLNTLSTDQSRGRVMAMYATVFAVGVMAGPLLLQVIGTAGPRPFQIGAACLALTALPLFSARGPSPSHSSSHRAPLLPILRAAPIVMLAALIAGLVESADISLLPLFGLHHGLDEQASLLLVTVFLVGNIVLQLPIGHVADRFGRRPVLGACAAVSTIGPLLLPFLLESTWALWPLLFIWGGMMYGFYTQGIALLAESYPPHELASANTVFVMVYCTGGVMGPTLGGVAMDFWTAGGLIVFLSGAASVLVVGLLAERHGS